MFQQWVFRAADSVLFLAGRPHFHMPDGSRAKGNSGGPICLIAYGEKNAVSLRDCGLPGYYVKLKGATT